jgi:hypothetical protein
MQNYLLALTLSLLIEPLQPTKTYELPTTLTAPIVRTCDVAPDGRQYYGPAC